MNNYIKNQNKTSYKNKIHKNYSLKKKITPNLIIKINKKNFYYNKKQIIKNNKFFQNIFKNKIKKTNSNYIQIKKTNIKTITTIIKFYKTKKLKLSINNIHQITKLTSKYQI